jgi:hypothetical protein
MCDFVSDIQLFNYGYFIPPLSLLNYRGLGTAKRPPHPLRRSGKQSLNQRYLLFSLSQTTSNIHILTAQVLYT